MPIQSLSQTIDAQSAGRVDLVVQKLTGVSRSQIRGLVDHGCVAINGKTCAAIGDLVQPADRVEVRYDPAQRYREKKKQWKDRTFDVVFEDDHFIVVDKSAGTLTVPTDNDESNTLVERLSVYLSHSRSKREACVVHRLDREVSGLLVFGKHAGAANALIEQFKDRKPQRIYQAIVAGVIPDDTATYRAHLATGKNLDRFIARPGRDTEEAITHFRVLRRLPDTTLVEIQLETGRRNQIRVQFAAAGHPVLGDPRYQKHKAAHPHWVRRRMALHAKTLGFIHPATGEEMTFDTELPAAMTKFLARGVSGHRD